MEKFSEAKLVECLNERGAAFNTKFKTFKEEFLKGNQYRDWIHNAMRVFKKLLLGDELQPMSKIYIVKMLKDCFETGFYPIVILIEVEILPVLRQICLYKKASTDQNRGKSYFTDRMQPAQLTDLKVREDYEKVGNSFLRFVLECIEVWALLKPHYYLTDIEVDDQPSSFATVYNELKNIEKVTFPDKRAYFNEEAIAKAKQSFKSNLDDLLNNTVGYVDYYTIVLTEALEKPDVFNGDNIQRLRRLQQHPDVMLVEEATKILRDNLESKATPISKIHSIQLLNDMFQDGLLEVVHQVEQYLPHLESYMGTLDQKETSLKRGDKALPVDHSTASRYYTNLLRSLILWSETVPKDPFDSSRQSKFRLTYQRLSKKYEFPYINDDEIKRYRNNYLNNSKRIAPINHVIFEQLNEERRSRLSSHSSAEAPKWIPEPEKPLDSNRSIPRSGEIPGNAFQKPPSSVGPPKQMPASNSKLQPPLPKKSAPPIPKNIAEQHIKVRFTILDSIYKYIESATIASENDDKEWLRQAMNYCEGYNSSYEEYMEANLEMSEFDERFDLGYSYFGVNDKLYSIFNKHSLSYSDKLKQAKSAIEKMHIGSTPGGGGNESAMKQDIELMRVEQPQESMESKKKIEENESKKKAEEAELKKAEEDKKRREQEDRRKKDEQEQRRRKQQEDRKKKEADIQRQKELEAQQQREETQRKKRDQLEKQRQLQLQRQKQELERQRKLEADKQRELEEKRKRQLEEQRLEEQKRRQLQIQRQLEAQKELQIQREKDMKKEKERISAEIASNESNSFRQRIEGESLPSQLNKNNLLMESIIRPSNRSVNKSGSDLSGSVLPNHSNISPMLPQVSTIDKSCIQFAAPAPAAPPLSNSPKFLTSTNTEVVPPSAGGSTVPLHPSVFSFSKKADSKVYDSIPNELSYKAEIKLDLNEENIEVDEQEQEGIKGQLIAPSSSIPAARNNLSFHYEEPPKPSTGIDLKKLEISRIRQQQNKTQSKQSSIIYALGKPTPINLPIRVNPDSDRNGSPDHMYDAEESRILEPNLEPLNQSFHDVDFKDFYSQVSAQRSPNFKNCFDFDKFLIPNRTISGKEKVYWLEQDAQILNSINRSMRTEPIRSSTSQGFYPKRSAAMDRSMHNSFVTLPELLAERTEKFDGQLKTVQERHRKEVDMLENKIKRLEKELREKDRIVSEQQMEILSMKQSGMSSRDLSYHHASKAVSVSPQKAEYLEQENQMLKSRLKQKQSYASGGYEPSWVASSPAPMTPLSHGIENSIQRYKESMKEPKGRMFFVDPYQPFLSVLNEPKLKKMMLKNKQLLFQNDHLQIGAIISLDSTLKIALYVQGIVAITDFTINLSKSTNLKATWYPERLASDLQPGKQERIIYSLEIIQIPYHLPQLEFSYKVQSGVHSSSVTMPCSFNRFMENKETDAADFNQQFESVAEEAVLRGPEVLYNKRLLKEPRGLEQLIPKIRLLNPFEQKDFSEGRSNLRFGLLTAFRKSQYILRGNIRPNQSLFFQGAVLNSGDAKPLEFLISTLNCLLSRDKPWA